MESEDPVTNTEWRRCIGCLKLQIAIRKTATNYRVLFREMTYENKATFASLPPCMKRTYMYEHVICVSYMWINMIKSKHPILNINKSQHPIPKMKTTYVCRFHTRMSCSYRPCGICEHVFVHTHKNEQDIRVWPTHDSFHWKCHTPGIFQIQKLKFLGTNSNWTKFSIWVCVVRKFWNTIWDDIVIHVNIYLYTHTNTHTRTQRRNRWEWMYCKHIWNTIGSEIVLYVHIMCTHS